MLEPRFVERCLNLRDLWCDVARTRLLATAHCRRQLTDPRPCLPSGAPCVVHRDTIDTSWCQLVQVGASWCQLVSGEGWYVYGVWVPDPSRAPGTSRRRPRQQPTRLQPPRTKAPRMYFCTTIPSSRPRHSSRGWRRSCGARTYNCRPPSSAPCVSAWRACVHRSWRTDHVSVAVGPCGPRGTASPWCHWSSDTPHCVQWCKAMQALRVLLSTHILSYHVYGFSALQRNYTHSHPCGHHRTSVAHCFWCMQGMGCRAKPLGSVLDTRGKMADAANGWCIVKMTRGSEARGALRDTQILLLAHDGRTRPRRAGLPRPVGPARRGLVADVVVGGTHGQRAVEEVANHGLQPRVVRLVLGEVGIGSDAAVGELRRRAVCVGNLSGEVVDVEAERPKVLQLADGWWE
eukprot:m.183663 g.183663  ORF g.183663 m.183663 type:complete len:403 (-) comp18483_c0_seq1:905-2113(-)